MSISIRDIQYFLAVAKSGMLSAAAIEQNVTQPTLTKAVQRVEAEFGLPLFERSARGMVLTSAGQRVLEQVQQLQAGYADTLLLASEMRAQQAGLLRLGVTDTTAGNRLSTVLAALLQARPGLRVRLEVGRSDALATMVSDGLLDLALVPAYEGQPLAGERTKLDADPMVPLVRAGHPLAQREQVSLADVAGYGWMAGSVQSAAYRVIADIFKRYKLPTPRVVMEVPFSSELNLSVLASTDLVTLVPRAFLHHAGDHRFVQLPVAALRVPRSLVLLARPGSAWSPLMQSLRDGLLKISRDASKPPRRD